MERYDFDIKGMTCAACQLKVEKSVKKIDGANNVSVNLLSNSMSVELEDGKSIEIVKAEVEKAGYGIKLKGESASSSPIDTYVEIEKEMRHRFFFSLAFLIPLMLVSMHHMLPLPSWYHELFHLPQHSIRFAFLQFILLLPIVYLNRNFFINGFKALFHLSPNMDSLIALGSFAAILYGIAVIFVLGEASYINDNSTILHYGADLYFEGAGMILTLITLGKLLETGAKSKTSKAISLLSEAAPKTAVVKRGNEEVVISAEDVKKDDILIVRPGLSLAADGVIISGSLTLDQRAITGESIPVDKTVGDEVISGSVNISGYAEVKAVKVGKDSTIFEVIKLVEEAANSKAPISRLADRIAAVFVPVVISIGLVTFISWFFITRNLSLALSFAISVLVVSCPCALGLATPVAIMVGTGKGARLGILFKSGEALEELGKVDVVCFDKTGTLTVGNPVVTDYRFYENENDVKNYLVSLENRSEHPIAKAVMEHFDGNLLNVEDYRTIPGKGNGGIVDKHFVLIGSERYLNEEGVDTTKAKEDANYFSEEGKTLIFVSVDGKLSAIVAVQDREKDSAIEAVKLINNLKIKTVMLTGDNDKVAKNFQKRLGLSEYKANLLPQDKDKIIRKYQEKGLKVAMVGDGINDAPSLMSSDVGIGIASGTDIAKESAMVVISNSSLVAISNAIELSRKVLMNIKENLFWAFFYNVLGIPLAAGVFYHAFSLKLSPMFAAFAMSLSSVCVVTNALRLNFFKNNTEIPKEEKMNREYFIKIDGMMCEHCVASVKKAIEKVEGVEKVNVSLNEKNAKVLASDGLEPVLKKAVEDAGYTVV